LTVIKNASAFSLFTIGVLDGIRDAKEEKEPGPPKQSNGPWGEQAVQSDFAVFRENLAAACRERNVTHDPLCAAAVDLHFAGVRALDIYRLAKIADSLEVSVDWLLGRSEVMELPKKKAKKPQAV
jgi:hypothetical protein